MWDEEADRTIYKVVVNHEEQYSIWPADRENPLGWNDVGKSGDKQECLDYIQEVWTDMRPLNLRQKMDQAVRREDTGKDDVATVNPGRPESCFGQGEIHEFPAVRIQQLCISSGPQLRRGGQIRSAPSSLEKARSKVPRGR